MRAARDVEAAEPAAAGIARMVRGALLEVRPLPMAAALCIALLGTLWAGAGPLALPPLLPVVLFTVFFGLMTAHFTDSYVDVVVRGDTTPGDYPLVFRDSTGLLSEEEYTRAIGVCVAFTAVGIGLIQRLSGWPAAYPLIGGLALALAYAPLLDRRFAGVTFGYPAGAMAVLLASYFAAGGPLDTRFFWLAGSLATALVGIKVRADVIDMDDDRKMAKRTVAALAGARAATRIGYGLAVGGLAAAAAAPAFFAVPVAFALPPVGAAAAFAATTRMEPLRAALWMSYAMLAALALEVAVLELA